MTAKAWGLRVIDLVRAPNAYAALRLLPASGGAIELLLDENEIRRLREVLTAAPRKEFQEILKTPHKNPTRIN
jgi:hypothetical protein